MSSFYAELEVAGATYPLRQCNYEFTQATDERGRVVAKVRHGLLQLTLDVPEDELLLAWAVAPYKPLAGHVTFYGTDQRTARETVSWQVGQCIGYQEVFEAGDVGVGAYVCQLVIATTKLTLSPGSVPKPFVAAAPREHGRPPQQLTSANADLMGAFAGSVWDGKLQSRHSYLGSPPLKRGALQRLRQEAQDKFGTELSVLQEGDTLLAFMRSNSIRAAFQASSNTVFVQPGATYYEVAHELKHAQQHAQLGVTAYAKQSVAEKELFVYEALVKEKHLLTSNEIIDATRYINEVRSRHNLPPVA